MVDCCRKFGKATSALPAKSSEVGAGQCLFGRGIAGGHRNSSTITALLLTDEDTFGPQRKRRKTGNGVFYGAWKRAPPPKGEEAGCGKPRSASACLCGACVGEIDLDDMAMENAGGPLMLQREKVSPAVKVTGPRGVSADVRPAARPFSGRAIKGAQRRLLARRRRFW